MKDGASAAFGRFRKCDYKPTTPCCRPPAFFEERTRVHEAFEVAGSWSKAFGGNESGHLLAWYACQAAQQATHTFVRYCLSPSGGLSHTLRYRLGRPRPSPPPLPSSERSLSGGSATVSRGWHDADLQRCLTFQRISECL